MQRPKRTSVRGTCASCGERAGNARGTCREANERALGGFGRGLHFNRVQKHVRTNQLGGDVGLCRPVASRVERVSHIGSAGEELREGRNCYSGLTQGSTCR